MRQTDYQSEIIRKTTGMIRTFLDELANETSTYKSLHNLTEQVEHQYHGRFLIELIQNAHDALHEYYVPGDQGRLEITIVHDEKPYGALYVANDGIPFTRSNFDCLSQLGQSDKDIEKSIGNKGIGFRSVLEIANAPEIYSRSSSDSEIFDGYCFCFTPDVTRRFETPILKLFKGDDKPCSPLDDTIPLVEWSRDRLLTFRNLYNSKDDQWLAKELKYLSPYLLPIPINTHPKNLQIKYFEDQGFASVIRLPFKSESARKLATEVMDQLDENTILFLERVKFLSLNSGRKQRLVERKVRDLDDRNDGQEITLEVIEDGVESYIKKKYWLWSVTIGGEDKPDEKDEIIKAIVDDDLPGRWPELTKATVSLAVRLDGEPEQGHINIYLPTQLPTGCAAHFSGPFYGDMSRTDINFKKSFNKLLLHRIGKEAIEIVLDGLMHKGVDEARVILDILAPSTEETRAGSEWFNVLKEACEEKGVDLTEKLIMLTDEGWTTISYASLIPEINSPNVLTEDALRNHATFAIIKKELMSRKRGIKSMFEAFGISPLPLDDDLAITVENIARELHKAGEIADWNGFWDDLIILFKNNAEPLKGKEILLGNDKELHAIGPDCTIFFPPRQGVDDDEIQDEGDSSDIPQTLRAHIAFLNDKIEIYNPKDARQQTPIRKFVESSLVQRYRVIEIIRSVLIPKIPKLPVALRSTKSRLCRDILLWGLKLVAGMPDRGKGRSGTLQLLRQIPVPCYGGWFPIEHTSFGPGWPNTAGADIYEYLSGANTGECQEALKRMLLTPTDKLWDGRGALYKDLLELSGTFDGLRIVELKPSEWESRTSSSKYSYHLPAVPPPCISENIWGQYTNVYSPRIRERLYYSGWFSYEVQSLSMIPGLDQYADFGEKTRIAFMNSLFASIHNWDESWLNTYIKKTDGMSQSVVVESPLYFCLKSLPWIAIDSDGKKEWETPSRRWYVPKIHLAGRSWQYAHLRPLPGVLADKIDRNPGLYESLAYLGMPKFNPDPEEKSSSTRLLDDLAAALDSEIPDRNMFMHHIRIAWSNYEASDGNPFPDRIIIGNGSQLIYAVKPDIASPVYLPDSSVSFVSELGLFSLPVIEINTADAKRLAPNFKSAYGDAVRLASELEVLQIIDGKRWEPEPGTLLSESEYAWLPSVLLTLYAFVGSPPPGLYAKKISGTAQTLRDSKICWVTSMKAGLWLGDEVIAEPPVSAMWISQEKVLVCDNAFRGTMSKYSEAFKAVIDRDDLELPLKHILEKLEHLETPTREDICAALESLKIKPAQYDQANDLWRGDLGQVIRMTMPVVVLLKPDSEIGVMADITTEEALLDYLQNHGISNPEPAKVLKLVRASDDYYALGQRLYDLVGESAQMAEWNEALERVGEKKLVNKDAEEEFRNQLRRARVPTQATLAHILRRNGEVGKFKLLAQQIDDLEFPEEMAAQFWDVKFEHTMPAVQMLLENWRALPEEISAFKNVQSPEELQARLVLLAGVNAKIDPSDIHKKNHDDFLNILNRFQKVSIAWCLRHNISPLSWEKTLDEFLIYFQDFFDHQAYLDLCNEKDIFNLLKKLPRETTHSDLWNMVDAVDDIRSLTESLSILPEDLINADKNLEDYKEKKRRQNRMISVCGKEFDSSEENLGALWHFMVSEIEEESLPDVGLNEMSRLSTLDPKRKKPSEGDRKKQTGKRPGRTPKAIENLIGFAGEIHAYRMLLKTYGNTVVHPATWKSSNSRLVFPENPVDDNAGCDFIINDKGRNFHVEVKSSSQDEEAFEFGSSEIRLAMGLVRKKKDIFLVMHVNNVLSRNPSFRLLPNPYDPKNKGLYSIEEAGARVRYKPK